VAQYILANLLMWFCTMHLTKKARCIRWVCKTYGFSTYSTYLFKCDTHSSKKRKRSMFWSTIL